MRKLPLIVTLVSISLVSAYALIVNLLPDTTEFPRIPTGPGTIGGTISRILGISDLENYTGDGTVPNTMMLSGTTSTGYLRGLNCGAGQVWKTLGGGMPTCANKDASLALLGTTSSISGTVTAYHANGTFEVISSATGILEGDIIRTNLGSALTIVFSDLSLLRIDEDSTVSLDTGTLPDGTTIAYAILENGGLWGRVLTETGGYYIGRNDLIVGVRGTSVYFTQHNPNIDINPSIETGWTITKVQSGGAGNLTVVDSASLGTVATLDCIDSMGVSHRVQIGTGTSIDFGQINALCPSEGLIPQLSRDGVFTRASIMTKVTENTVKDLQYLSQYVFSGANALTPGKNAKILSEYNATFPRSGIDLDAICPDVAAGGIIKTFWPTLIGTGIEMDPCQDQRTLAVADFRRIDLHEERRKLFLRIGNPVSPSNGNSFGKTAFGVEINAGQYIDFDIGLLGFDLRGKDLTIKFLNIPGDCNLNKCYVANFGSEKIFIQKNATCTGPGVGFHLCRKILANAATEIQEVTGLKEITFGITEMPTQFLLGNSSNAGNSPINNTINKITIQ